MKRLLDRVPAGTATLVSAWALASAVLAVVSPLDRLLRPVTRFVDTYVAFFVPNLAFAAFLAILAGALSTRKRAGWWVLVVVLAANLLDPRSVDGSPVLQVGSAVLGLVLLVLVVAARGRFGLRVRRAALLKALAVLAAALAVSAVVGVVVVELARGTLPAGERVPWVLNHLGGNLLGDRVFDGRPPEPVADLVGFLGALSLVVALLVFFQSQHLRAVMGPGEERAVRALLDTWGGDDSLGYFATRRDKAVVFSPDGRAAVTYRVEVGACLASADPIGAPASWPAAIAAWLELARRHGWVPAVMGAGEAGARAYAAAGLEVLQLGDEAVLDVSRFSLEGAEMAPVRQAVRRVERQGVQVRIRRHRSVGADELAAVEEAAERWRGDEPERGFSMALGRLGDPADGDCLLVEALAADGRLLAVLSLVPWGPGGVSLDLMRRDPTAPNGVVELMVARLATSGGRVGVARVSLNFAVFRSAFDTGARIGAGPVLRAWRRLLLVASRWWQLEALYRSNVKYAPTWVARFVCYADARDLVRVSLAFGIAEGFVTPPRWTSPRGGLEPEHLPDDRLAEIVAAARRADEARLRDRPRPEQVRVRLDKLERAGAAYPRATGEPPTPVRDAHALAAGDADRPVVVVGRVLRVRDHGGVVFLDLADQSGETQVVLEASACGAGALERYRATCDLGDLVRVEATTGRSRRGEPSLLATGWALVAKCLHPLPDPRAGALDPELRVRRRSLDLVLRPEARDAVRTRAAVLGALRGVLDDDAFVEVETPVLQRVHGGASARPFLTHLNAYDQSMSLRIAPELYLKRLAVGGLERVYELGRVFRNEGVDRRHNPEFTVLEAYQAHVGYEQMRILAQRLVVTAAERALGRTDVVLAQAGAHVDLASPWAVVRVHDAVSQVLGHPVDPGTPAEVLRPVVEALGLETDPDWDADRLVLEVYEERVEPATVAPTFFCDFPTGVCPLTRASDTDPRVAERWDLVVDGVEVATAYTELTDPREQRRRLTAQSLLAAGGDPEAMELDEDFLEALELGMLPTGGLGLGVDRLVMLLTGQPIRETLAFPFVRDR